MILECRNLTKKYRGKKAVADLSLSLEEGKIYSLLGENGCGKTTLMKMIAGLVKPTEGEILYHGHPLGHEDKEWIAYMSTEPFYYDFMRVEDVGQYYEDFFPQFDREYFQELTGRFGLEDRMKTREMSTGMSAKLKIAATLARKAELCMLDEPLNGVDYKAREEIISLILEEADGKRTFLMSTHLIEEIESFVETAFFIREGQLVKEMDLEMERMASGRSLTDVYLDIM